MPLELVRNDITTMRVDAIVNAANETLLGGGGVDGAIHRAAGPGLLQECRALGGCAPGQAKITGGYALPARYVIHTVGPVWRGGTYGERETLSACYENALLLAEKTGCETVAFPLISAGAYGYPPDQALAVAVDAVSRFLLDHELTVYLALFGRTEFLAGKQLFRDVQAYIDDVYAESHYSPNLEARRRALWREDQAAALHADQSFSGQAKCPSDRPASPPAPASPPPAASKRPLFPFHRKKEAERETDEIDRLLSNARPLSSPRPAPGASKKPSASPRPAPGAPGGGRPGALHSISESAAPRPADGPPDWEALLRRTDEGFSQALLRLIDERGLTDAQCYKRANVDRKLFSKIRSNPDYRPSKATACAFAVALRLTLPEAADLLRRAGFALTSSSKFDIVLEYFLQHRVYDVYEINQVLFQFDLPLLGSGAGLS